MQKNAFNINTRKPHPQIMQAIDYFEAKIFKYTKELRKTFMVNFSHVLDNQDPFEGRVHNYSIGLSSG